MSPVKQFVAALVIVSTVSACADARIVAQKPGRSLAQGGPSAREQRVTFAADDASFALPQGWKVLAREADTIALGPDRDGQSESLLFVHVGAYAGFEQVSDQLAKTLREDLTVSNLRYQVAPATFRVNSLDAVSTTILAENRFGHTLVLHFQAVLSGQGKALAEI